jgi:hypothetical protein
MYFFIKMLGNRPPCDILTARCFSVSVCMRALIGQALLGKDESSPVTLQSSFHSAEWWRRLQFREAGWCFLVLHSS